jgi:hypothetical protein
MPDAELTEAGDDAFDAVVLADLEPFQDAQVRRPSCLRRVQRMKAFPAPRASNVA